MSVTENTLSQYVLLEIEFFHEKLKKGYYWLDILNLGAAHRRNWEKVNHVFRINNINYAIIVYQTCCTKDVSEISL